MLNHSFIGGLMFANSKDYLIAMPVPFVDTTDDQLYGLGGQYTLLLGFGSGIDDCGDRIEDAFG